MGILDALNSTDPSQQAQLALAAHLLGARSVKGERGGFGQALGGGLLAYQQAMEQGRGNEMKRKMQQLQMDAAEREAKANLPPSADDMAKFTGLMTGTPERMDVAGNPNAYMPPTPAQPANPMGAYGFAMGSQNPNLQKIGVQGMHQFPQLEATRMEKEDNRAWRTQESQATRDAAAKALQEKLIDARTSQAERLAAQKELREMQIAAQRDMKQFGASLAKGLSDQKLKTQYDPTRGGIVNMQTGEFTPSTQNGVPIGPKATPLKDAPASVQKAMMENSANLRKAQNSLDLIEGKQVGVMQGDTAATGWKGFAPDFALNRLDPAGVDTRAAIADLGSMIIHERSGAAVTASEFPRLQPFIPKPNDAPEVAKKKLKRFVQVYNEELTAMQNAYGPDSGYRQPGGIIPKPPDTPKRIRLDAQGNVIP